ncbi:MAG: calcium-binding protein [Xenococcaceae cyanobacterium MO_188.B32]|nr:calcium-binding protein [Xenococcaceae cyanobacterium MO_188.B32]
MSITISGQTATSDLTINAPTSSQSFPDYFIGLIDDNGFKTTPQFLSISVPTTFTGINLTSFGKTTFTADGFDSSVWRIRNGDNEDVSGTLRAYGFGFSNTYNLPGNTDTFVFSPDFNGSATHILTVNEITKTKSASNNLFNEKTNSLGGDSYKIIGGSGNDRLTGDDLDDTLHGNDGNDTLRGGGGRDLLKGGTENDLLFGQGGRDSLEGEAGNDTLVGDGGRDTLTGGAGSDKFQFSDRGRDKITDFSTSDGDIFQIDYEAYTGMPVDGIIARAGSVDDSDINIYVDTFNKIRNARPSGVHFAYATNNNRLFFDADGDWSNDSRNDRTRIADTNEFGSPTSENFEFI